MSSSGSCSAFECIHGHVTNGLPDMDVICPLDRRKMKWQVCLHVKNEMTWLKSCCLKWSTPDEMLPSCGLQWWRELIWDKCCDVILIVRAQGAKIPLSMAYSTDVHEVLPWYIAKALQIFMRIEDDVCPCSRRYPMSLHQRCRHSYFISSFLRHFYISQPGEVFL